MLRWRDGREWRGRFKAGLLDGPGSTRDRNGDMIEAMFVAGQAQGDGVYRARAGWVWSGPFVDGVMQGAGEMTEAGGRRYSMVMEQGRPATGLPEGLAAHPLVSGLRPAQGGASMADRAEISVFVDQRLSANQWGAYHSWVDGAEIVIQPTNQAMIDIWNGEPSFGVRSMFFEAMEEDWADTRALTVFSLTTHGGERVTLEDLSLQVSESVPHLRPMVMSYTHMGCNPFEPSFGFVNHGWGAVQNPRLRVRFANADDIDFDDIARTSRSTNWVEISLAAFAEEAVIDLRGALVALGADIDRLAAARPRCPSLNELTACRTALVDTGIFGDIGAHLNTGFDKVISTQALAELTFDWTDHFGTTQTELRHYDVGVSLGFIDADGSLAECGAGGAWPIEAPQFHDVTLPFEGTNYTVALPWRGSPNVSDFEYGVKFHAPRTSYHVLQAQARFSDGSMRLSPETVLYFVNPRQPVVLPHRYGASCSLSLEDTGMC